MSQVLHSKKHTKCNILKDILCENATSTVRRSDHKKSWSAKLHQFSETDDDEDGDGDGSCSSAPKRYLDRPLVASLATNRSQHHRRHVPSNYNNNVNNSDMHRRRDAITGVAAADYQYQQAEEVAGNEGLYSDDESDGDRSYEEDNGEESENEEDDDEEFRSVLRQVAAKRRRTGSEVLTARDNGGSLSQTNLRYLYKLLKFYKLEHYTSELVEAGYHTAISLHKLEPRELDKLAVSPYDKKKIVKLQLFIKQGINTIRAAATTRSKPSESEQIQADKVNTMIENFHKWQEMPKKPQPPGTSAFSNFRSNKLANSDAKPTSKNETVAASLHAASAFSISSTKVRPTPTKLSNNVTKQAPSWNDAKQLPPKQPLFVKNPNATHQSNGKIKRTVASASSAANKTAASVTSSVRKPVASLQQRAKSSEPISARRGSQPTLSLSRDGAAAKSTVSLDQGKVICSSHAVRHPILAKARNKPVMFGPKINQPPQRSQSSHNIEAASATYNYGVPVTQAQTQQMQQRQAASIHKAKSAQNLYQEQQEGGGAAAVVTTDIYVYARKRPKLASEAKFGDSIVVECNVTDHTTAPPTTSIRVDEVKSAVDGTPVLRKNEFTFDRTFDSTFSNEDIFKSSILPFVEVPSENRNDFTCICFGQTGSGKTHTLFGNGQQDGVCVLTAQTLFTTNERLLCGFYEIYNGQLYDLLNQKNKLVLREDGSGVVNVVGLGELEIRNVAQLRKAIETAQANRHIGCTSFNKASSRSHAVFQFKVPNAQNNYAANGSTMSSSSGSGMRHHSTAPVAKSKVNSGLTNGVLSKQPLRPFRVLFIDLAGSERGIDAQNNEHDNRKEGAEINQSLLALKECIRCIDQFYAHAPFRQSKLTRVLRDAFVGAGRTVLIATVSPTEDCVSCSLNTLQYANRVRQMTMRSRRRSDKMSKRILTYRVATRETDTAKTLNHDFVGQRTLSFSSLSTTTKPFSLAVPTQIKHSSTTNFNNPLIETTAYTRRQASTSSLTSALHIHESAIYRKDQCQESHVNDSTADKSSFKQQPCAQSPMSLHATQANTASSSPIKTNHTSVDKVSSKSTTEATETTAVPEVAAVASSSSVSSPHRTTNNNNAPNLPLFHPSKINMSSTPIKSREAPRGTSDETTNTNNQPRPKERNDELIFEHDTPIKGHKIRQVTQQFTADRRYFSRENVKLPKTTAATNRLPLPSMQQQDCKEHQRWFMASSHNEMLFGKEAVQVQDEHRTKMRSGEKYIQRYEAAAAATTATVVATHPSPLQADVQTQTHFQSTALFQPSRPVKIDNSSTTTATCTPPSAMPASSRHIDIGVNTESTVETSKLADDTNCASNTFEKVGKQDRLIDDTLNRLREKQREMLQFKNKLLTATPTTANDSSLLDVTADCSVSQNRTSNSNSQKQLRVYIKSLENKLVSLRNEMKDTSLSVAAAIASSPNKTATTKEVTQNGHLSSSDSADSLKECGLQRKDRQPTTRSGISQQPTARLVYTEFLDAKQRRAPLPQTAYQSASAEIAEINWSKFGESHEALFIEKQRRHATTERLASCQEGYSSPTPAELKFLKSSENASRHATPSSSDEQSSASEYSLSKSLHNGATSNLFAKLKKDLSNQNAAAIASTSSPTVTKAPTYSKVRRSEDDSCAFTPIIKVFEDLSALNQTIERNKVLSTAHLNAALGTAAITKTSESIAAPLSSAAAPLVNPIPIRLCTSSSSVSSSSSFDSANSNRMSQLFDRPPAEMSNGIAGNERVLSTATIGHTDLTISSGTITASVDGLINGGNCYLKANTVPVKMPNSGIWKTANNHMGHAPSHKTKGDLSSYSSYDMSKLIAPYKNVTSFSTRDQHGTTLSDSGKVPKSKEYLAREIVQGYSEITGETKQEMNLGFNEYLSRVEDMLKSKATSIRDLQQQITQLRSYPAAPSSINSISSTIC